MSFFYVSYSILKFTWVSNIPGNQYNMFINLVVIVVFSSSLVTDKLNLENNLH